MRVMILLLGTVMGTGAILLGLRIGVDPVEGLKLASRYTARASFLIFIPVFVASALYRLWPGHYTKEFYRARRWWGLNFALAHTIHLAAFVAYFSALGDPVPMIGAPVYAMIYVMALTSNNPAQRLLGANWKRLHKAGIYVIWAAFTLAYTGKAVTGEQLAVSAPLALVCYAALGLRIQAWRRKRASLATA